MTRRRSKKPILAFTETGKPRLTFQAAKLLGFTLRSPYSEPERNEA